MEVCAITGLWCSLDVLGRTRATGASYMSLAERSGNETPAQCANEHCNCCSFNENFSKRKSSACADYVPCPLYTPPVATTDWMYLWDRHESNSILEPRSWSNLVIREAKVNKVSVGEPSEGSLHLLNCTTCVFLLKQTCFWRWAQPASRGPNFKQPLFYQLVTSDYYLIVKTFNNGSHGSRIDEERAAKCDTGKIFVNHRIFWMHIAPLVFRRACLFASFPSNRRCWAKYDLGLLERR